MERLPTHERLVARLRGIGIDIPDDWECQNIHAGKRQREAGAWSWEITAKGTRTICASFVSATDLLKAKVISAHLEGRHERTLIIEPTADDEGG